MGRDSNTVVPITLVDGLPFVSVDIVANGSSINIEHVLVDTGSAGCIFSADLMLEIGLVPSADDMLHVITGIGGSEFTFSKTINELRIGPMSAKDFQVEVGAMDYGFNICGILGMSFLLEANAKIDLECLELVAPQK